MLSRYAITVGDTVRRSTGEQLVAPATISFQTADGQWQTPNRLETLDIRAIAPREFGAGWQADAHTLATRMAMG